MALSDDGGRDYNRLINYSFGTDKFSTKESCWRDIDYSKARDHPDPSVFPGSAAVTLFNSYFSIAFITTLGEIFP